MIEIVCLAQSANGCVSHRPQRVLRCQCFGVGICTAYRSAFCDLLICKLFEHRSDAKALPRLNRMERISVRTTKKVKKVVRREWTPIEKISKETKRTIGALRVKASQLGIGLGHQR